MNLNTSILAAVSLLKSLEGFSAKAYWDVNGYAIGFGNHYYENGQAVKSGDTITAERAVSLLEFYAAQNAKAIAAQLAGPVSPGLLTSLISLRYNCGTITNSLLSLINSGADLGTIKDKFLSTCITVKGTYNNDLAIRRDKEWEAGLNLAGVSLLITGAVLLGLFWAFKTIYKK
jgi:GH24 family phage-related lysozyme (muramidase)